MVVKVRYGAVQPICSNERFSEEQRKNVQQEVDKVLRSFEGRIVTDFLYVEILDRVYTTVSASLHLGK